MVGTSIQSVHVMAIEQLIIAIEATLYPNFWNHKFFAYTL